MTNIWKNIKWSELNYGTIVKGWYYKLIKKRLKRIPLDQLQQSAVRKSFCNDCPLNTNGWCDSSKEAEDINGNIVNGCGCELEAKQLSPDAFCPRSLWKEMLDTQNWEQYIIKINEFYINNNKSETPETVINEEDLNIINNLLNG